MHSTPQVYDGRLFISLPPQEFPMSLINKPVQPFKTQAFHNGKFIEVTE
jgi:hypothetical protein